MHQPLFSIVIPSRDRPDDIENLIWSVLEQNFSDFEIIICDNSTNDLTQEVIKRFKDDRIVNIKTGNLKMYENWNCGINAVLGKYMMLISDKAFLKQGALIYLKNLIYAKKYKCITWKLDTYVEPNTLLTQPTNSDSREVKSSELIKAILGADYYGFEDAPMHCTSCVSMEVISEIKNKHKNVCQALNPDYTMAMHILLSIKSVYRINQNLALLIRPSFLESFGNGAGFLKKTESNRNFMQEHIDWFQNTNDSKEIPIKDNNFIIDIILKDVYEILKCYKIDPDTFLNQQDRLTGYYFYTFKEILWRKRMGVNMSDEYKLWIQAFNGEITLIQDKVNQKREFWWLLLLKANLIYFLKTNPLTAYLLIIYRAIKYKDFGKKFNDIEDYYKKNEV